MTDHIAVVARAIAIICNERGQELASKVGAQAPPIPWQAFEREAKAAIAALEAQGLVIVPREPTKAMLDAVEWDFGNIPVWWQAMLAALEVKE